MAEEASGTEEIAETEAVISENESVIAETESSAEVVAEVVAETEGPAEAAEEPEEKAEAEDIEEPESEETREPGNRGWRWVACVIPVLALMGIGGYYWSHHAEPVQPPVGQEEPIAAVAWADTMPSVALTDTIPAAVPADTVSPAEPAAVEAKSEAPKVAAPRPPRPDDRQIMHNADGTPMTVSLGVGERLTLLSQRLYGDKAFWGYIYEVNAFQLANPNVVPCHVKLLLPDAAYYGIDASDSLSIRRGKQKQSEIFKNVMQ